MPTLSVIPGGREKPSECELALSGLSDIWLQRRTKSLEARQAARVAYRWLHAQWVAARREGRDAVAW